MDMEWIWNWTVIDLYSTENIAFLWVIVAKKGLYLKCRIWNGYRFDLKLMCILSLMNVYLISYQYDMDLIWMELRITQMLRHESFSSIHESLIHTIWKCWSTNQHISRQFVTIHILSAPFTAIQQLFSNNNSRQLD